MKKKLKDVYNKILKGLLKWKARRSLIRKYIYLQQVNEILENWITKRILEGQQGRRKELLSKQNEIKETDAFLKFLRREK